MADGQCHCTFGDDCSRIWCVPQWALGRFDAAAAIDGDRSFCFLLLPLQKCQPRTSANATPRACLIIRNPGLEMAQQQHHHRFYLRPRFPVYHHHHGPISWHPHRARVSSLNNPATRRGPDFLGLDLPQSASPSSIYTRHPAFQTLRSRCCSRLPGVSLRCIPHRRLPSRLVNTKARNPSPGLSQRSPAAHSSTRPLAQRFLTCTGRQRRFTLNAVFLP